MSERVKRGQVWGTPGPYGWVRVEAVLLPGHEEYDGGAPGIVIRDRSPKGRWTNRTWFVIACDDEAALKHLRSHNYNRTPIESNPS